MVSSVIDSVVIVGDRILVRPLNPNTQTSGGLYLPASVKEKDEVRTGVVVKVGPGYPIPSDSEQDPFLAETKDPVRYIPLQVQIGDQALYLQKHSIEIEVEGEKYLIVPQNAVLMVFRDSVGLDL